MKPSDLHSSQNEILLNPRMPEEQAENLKKWLESAAHLQGHVFILTSGSSAANEADYKWVALSKQTILNAAQSSNEFLSATKEDTWFATLPTFHVGGLSIYARAELAGSKIKEATYDRWDPQTFTQQVEGTTLTSLVPTQVYDLVQKNLECPKSLRAILVGGGAFNPEIAEAARKLGWPVLATYGLSETASQVATQSPTQTSKDLQILNHLEAKTNEEGRIQIRGSSLLTGYITRDGFFDPKDQEGWLTTDDLGHVEGRTLQITGRTRDRIKIGGELANLALLRQTWEQASQHLNFPTALTGLPDERLENIIVLAAEQLSEHLEKAIEIYNAQVLPFERIRKTYEVKEIPKTDLGKIKWQALAEIL